MKKLLPLENQKADFSIPVLTIRSSKSFLNRIQLLFSQKLFQTSNFFKKAVLLFSCFLIIASSVTATTYYLTAAGQANAQLPGSWNTNPGSGGTAATNFTTNGDVFIIPSGINGVVSANWTFGNGSGASAMNLIINGTLTVNSGSVITLAQKNSGTNTITVNGSLNFSGSTAGVNQLVGSLSGSGSSSNNILNVSGGGTIKTANTAGIISTTNGSINATNLTATFNAAANFEFNGTSAQGTLGLPATVNTLTINNASGVTLGSIVNVTNLTIGNTTGGSVFNDGGNQISSTGTLNLTSGTFNIGNGSTATQFPGFTTNNIGATTTVNYASSGGQTIAAVNYGNLTNTGNGTRALANTGIIGVAGSYTPSTGTNFITGSTVSFNGTAAQTIPAYTFNNLIINNPAGISSIGAGVTVNQSLALTNGVVTTGANKIIVGTSGSVSRTNGWINGNLQQHISSTGTVIFPIGDATGYRPVTVNFTSLSTQGDLTASVTQADGQHAAIAASGLNSAQTLKRYWNLTGTNGLAGTYDATFGFVAADIPAGAATGSFEVRNYNNPNWATTSIGTRTGSSTQATGLTTFGDFAIGQIIGFPTVNLQPSNSSVCLGNNTSFTSSSPSTPVPTVKWQRSTDGITWTDIDASTDGGIYTNFTSNTLNISNPPLSVDGYKYRSVYTNINGSVNSNAATLTVTDPPTLTVLDYAGSPFANIVSSPQPVTLSGTNAYTGGTYTSDGGLTINVSSGAITPNTSSVGFHTVTYTTPASGGCPAVQRTTQIEITTAPTATISYNGNPFCESFVGTRAVTITGTSVYTNGSYSAPAGLTMDAFGTITPGTSTPGTYTVTYTIPPYGGHPSSQTTTDVTITAVPTATISYAGGPFCTSDETPQPVTLTGTGAYTGGVFTSDADLVLDAVTGAFTPSGSSGGTHTITYTVPASGGCAAVPVTVSVDIVTKPDATLSYAGNPFCKAINSPQAPTLTGTSGGTYSSTAGLTINAATGAITPSTSTPGDYIVTYTIPATGPCGIVQITAPVTINVTPTATIDYPGQPYCSAGADKAVTLTGTEAYTGGSFASTPAGLTLNTTTGTISPATSAAGIYDITYTTPNCPVQATTQVEITAAPSATINYATNPFCLTEGTPQAVTLTGDNSGVFSAPSGLSINSNNGDITPSTSTPGNYTVTYTIPASGTCPAVPVTTNVSITAQATATIDYTGSPYCTSLSGNVAVTLTGTNNYTGGTYSAAAGLSINTSNGSVRPSTSTPGTYTVTYTIPPVAGGCSVFSTTTSVTITALPVATFNYNPVAYCQNGSNPIPVFTGGGSGGIFSSTAGLNFLDPATGEIDLASSTPGNYTVTNTISAADGCATVSATSPVTITALPAATISYASSPYCKSLAASQSVTFTGTTGGTYTASPAGLSINATSGAITPGTSTAGDYIVTYTIQASGGCAAVTATAPVTITAVPTGSLSYAGAPFCTSDASGKTPTLTGTGAYAGGTYSSTAGLSLASDGTITASTSTPGSYTVTYTIPASGGCASVPVTALVTITALPTANISYGGATTNFCKGDATAKTVTLTGTGAYTGGTYTASPAGLSIDAATGTITPSSSTANSYVVTYTTPVSGGCNAVTATTNVIIEAVPTGGTTSSSTNLFACAGTNTGSVSVAGQDGNITKWQSSVNGGLTWTDINTTASTINYTNLTQTTWYRAVVTKAICSGITAYSTHTVVSVVPQTGPGSLSAFANPTMICTGSSTLTAIGLGADSTVGALTGGSFDNAGAAMDNQQTPGLWRKLVNGVPTNIEAQLNNTINSPFNLTNDKTFLASPCTPVYYNNNPLDGQVNNNKFMAVVGPNTSSLETPIFNLVGLTSATIDWWEAYILEAGASIKTEISTDGGNTYGTLLRPTINGATTYGSPTNFAKTSIDLSAYIGLSNLRIRFTWTGTQCSSWGLEKATITKGFLPANYTWNLYQPAPVDGTPPGHYLNVFTAPSVIVTPPSPNNTNAPLTYSYSIVSSAGGCASNITVTVNPNLVTSVATPNQTVCSGSAITPITYNSNIPASTTFNWIRDNTTNVTGIANSGTGSITGTPVNNTSVTQTVTFTITPSAPNTCSNTPFTSVITINPNPVVTLSGGGTICGNQTATLTLTTTGALPVDVTLSNGTTYNVTSSPFNISVQPATTTTYSITALPGGSCAASPITGTATVTVPTATAPVGTWICGSDNDWFNPCNWGGAVVPTNSIDVTIPNSAPCSPVIDPTSSYAPADKIARSRNILIGTAQNLSFANGGDLFVAGNWQNDRGSAGFTANTGTVTMMGAVAQTITTTAGSTEAFYNLTINNTSNLDNAVTLNNPATVSGVFTLVDGILKTASDKLLTILNPATAAVVGGANNTYVWGPIARNTAGTGDYSYPVGNPNGPYGEYRPAITTPQSANATTYMVEYKIVLPDAPLANRGGDLTGILTTEHWQIDRTSGTADAVIKLPYINPGTASHWTDNTAPCTNCNVAIVTPFAPSDYWYFTNGTNFNVGFSPDENRLYTNNGIIFSKPMSAFGDFTFGYGYPVILPVQLLTFEGNLVNGDAKLDWSITNDKDLAGFELEYSRDGQRFNKLVSMPANGNNYTHLHKLLPGGSHYYRLLVKDKNGRTFYSNTILLVLGKNITVIKGLRPTIVTTETFIEIHSVEVQTVKTTLLNTTGKRVAEQKAMLVRGDNNLRINTQLLVNGFYMLHVKTEDGASATLKFIKQ